MKKIFVGSSLLLLVIVTSTFSCRSNIPTQDPTTTYQNLIASVTATSPTATPLGKWWIAPITPDPTLSSTVQNELYRLLETNGHCELPCFLGIIPGETMIDDAKNILGKYSSRGVNIDQAFDSVDQQMYFTQIFTNIDVSLMLIIQFLVQDGIIQEIRFQMDTRLGVSFALFDQHLARFSLREIFDRHGPPDIVYIDPPDISIRSRAYAIHVIYEQEKLLFTMSGGASLNAEERYRICPIIGEGDIGQGRFTFMSPFNPDDIKTRAIISKHLSFPVEEVLDISIEDFYQRVLLDTPACFDI